MNANADVNRNLAPFLIVDDNPDDFEATLRSIRKAGIKNPIDRCVDGEDCLAYLFREGAYSARSRSEAPQLIILDLNLPGTDGRDVLKELHKDQTLEAIPVIVFSTSEDERDVRECYQFGASAYMKKTTDISTLAATIRRLCDKSPHKRHHQRILIVDDNPDDREYYRRLLRHYEDDHLDFVEASSAQEGLDLVDSINPDCILLDYYLHDLNGVEFLQELQKRHQKTKQNPPSVLMLTGHGSETIAANAIKLGADDYLVKNNLNQETLERALARAIQTHELRSKLHTKKEEFSLFTCALSHDLRAPLRRSRIFCDYLSESLGEEVTEESQSYLDMIVNNLNNLDQLINALMGFYSISELKAPLKPLKLNYVVTQALDILHELVQEHRPTLKIADLPMILGHAPLLIELFQNLIQNAIKYRSEDPLQIEVSAQDTGDHLVRICITDNGSGIDSDKSQQIFQPLYRANKTVKVEGCGLGLSICEKIIKYHGGNIWADGKAERGARFYFTLPKA
ncbi:MAG: hypothetical protein COA42_04735 [Alteromonadaceae bacterium]|nr:MAG: hypothetical protein COA42_04735 [Alteromonadaceae bacterium]